ncbi:MAG: hypothetical protein GY953_28560, partial [bacterium]|nr:hypothetical protein [bacterium]
MRPTALAFLLVCYSGTAAAYSIAVTRAIEAPTIAEIFIEENRIRAELEIGDTPADEIWQRLSLFVGGRFLKPRLLSRTERARARRDPFTGELLPADEDAVQVVVAG